MLSPVSVQKIDAPNDYYILPPPAVDFLSIYSRVYNRPVIEAAREFMA